MNRYVLQTLCYLTKEKNEETKHTCFLTHRDVHPDCHIGCVCREHSYTADGTLKLDNANFGVPTDCAVAPTSGVTDIDDVAAGTDDDVRIGVIPTKELGLKSNAKRRTRCLH